MLNLTTDCLYIATYAFKTFSFLNFIFQVWLCIIYVAEQNMNVYSYFVLLLLFFISDFIWNSFEIPMGNHAEVGLQTYSSTVIAYEVSITFVYKLNF